MAASLREQQATGPSLAHYVVLVNFYALTFAVGLETEQHSSFSRFRLQDLQKKYRNNAIYALQQVSVLDPPSLTLLQTLLQTFVAQVLA